MNSPIVDLVNGKIPSREEIESMLYEICDREHSGCNNSCPVYELNGSEVPNTKPFEENRGCDCFKNGKAMYDFIKEKSK